VKLCKANVLSAIVLGAGLLAGCSGESADSMLAASRISLEKRDTRAAVIQLKGVLQKQPSSAEARYLMGRALLLSGDPESALIEFNKAEELGYSAELLAPEHARVLLLVGQAAKALDKYRDVKLQSPSANAQLLAQMAAAYWAIGKKDEAWAVISAAQKADGNDRTVGLVHVRMQATVPPLSNAQAELDALLKRFPDFADAWMLKADLLQRAGASKAQEIEAYREALKWDRAALGAHAGIITWMLQERDLKGAEKALDALKVVAPGSGQAGYLSALLAMHQGNQQKAREEVQRLLKRAPSNVPVLHLAGAIEFQRGALLQADAHLNKALAQAPEAADIRLLLARVYVRAGEAGKALAVAQPLLSAKEPNPELFPLLGEALLQTGDPLRAEQMFAKAASLNPQDVASRVAAVMSRTQAKSKYDGTAELRAIAVEDKGVTADLALVSVLLRKKDYEQASKALDALAKKEPNKPLADNLRGNLELARGDQERARAAFQAALSKDPTFFPAAASLSKLAVDANDFKRASQYFEGILKVEPRNLQARISLINLKVQQGAPKDALAIELTQLVKEYPEAVAPRVALVQLQMARGENKLALAVAQEGATLLPDNVEILLSLGSALAGAGDTNQAVATYSRAATLSPQSPQPHIALAEVHSRAKNYGAATQSLKRALAIKPGNLAAMGAMYGVEMAAGRIDEALIVARSLQGQETTAALGFVLEGDAELKRHHLDAAAEAYRKALDKGADTSFAIKLHRTLASADKRMPDADKFAKRWLEQFPKDALFIHHLGDVALKRADLNEAARRYGESLALVPRNASAANNLSWIALQQGRRDEAVKYGEAAVAIEPNNPQFLDSLASALASSGKLDRAIEVQKRAIELAPDLHIHRLHLARLLIDARKGDLAKLELQRLLELGDAFAQQAEVREALIKLKQ